MFLPVPSKLLILCQTDRICVLSWQILYYFGRSLIRVINIKSNDKINIDLHDKNHLYAHSLCVIIPNH
jgi:hypothetical protein